MARQLVQFILITVFLFMAIIPLSNAEDKVRLTSGEYPPYISENLKHYGYVSRIVTEAFALEGVTVEYSFFPPKRAYEITKKGRWDGSTVWAISEERTEFFIFSDPVVSEQVVFFHLKSVPFDWGKLDDLKGVKIGATLGYNYGAEFEKAEKNKLIDVERVANDEINFKKLLRKRIPIIISNIAVGYNLLNKIYNPETVALFTNHPKPLQDKPLHLILTKAIPENEARMVKFNMGLKKLKESGKYDQFVQESRDHMSGCRP